MTIMGNNILNPKKTSHFFSLTSTDSFALLGKKTLRLCNSEAEVIPHIQSFIWTETCESWKPPSLLARLKWPAPPTSKSHRASGHTAWVPLLQAAPQGTEDTASARPCRCWRFPGPRGISFTVNWVGSWRGMNRGHHLPGLSEAMEEATLIAPRGQW